MRLTKLWPGDGGVEEGGGAVDQGGSSYRVSTGLHVPARTGTIVPVTQNATSADQACIFCAIVARLAEASVVYEDESVVAFMDLNPVTPGHLLVVSREHAVGLEDLDGAVSARVWSVGHDLARALRRSSLRCEGINVILCDGEVAFQTVFHFHLHVIPRYAGDGWALKAESLERERSLLDSDARAIRSAIASTD
jgi:histidine triad (HIT) family protein